MSRGMQSLVTRKVRHAEYGVQRGNREVAAIAETPPSPACAQPIELADAAP